MRDIRSRMGLLIIGVFALVATAGGIPSHAATAAAALPKAALRSLGSATTFGSSEYDAGNWASPDSGYDFVTATGSLAVVTPDESHARLLVREFDPSSLAQLSTRQIDLTGWPLWGGFLAAPDGNFYVLIGRQNPDEDDALKVVAVRKYAPDWSLSGTAYVTGGSSQGVKGIYTPFDAGSAHMLLLGGRLVVHMSRLIYAIDGVHHQVNFTFEVDPRTMRAVPFADLGGYQYSSHSFQQLVTASGQKLVLVDHGDAYPRTIQMGVMANYPASRSVVSYHLFDFNGETGNNFTGASVTDVVSGPRGIVVLGNSIRQPQAPNGPLGSADEARNVFLIHAAVATGSHAVKWLTSVAPHGVDAVREPRAVKLAQDRFAVLFQTLHGSSYTLQYRLIDSAGNVLASRSFPDVYYTSVSAPIVLGQRIVWVGHGPADSVTYLFGLDVSDPSAPVVGHESA